MKAGAEAIAIPAAVMGAADIRKYRRMEQYSVLLHPLFLNQPYWYIPVFLIHRKQIGGHTDYASGSDLYFKRI